MSTTHEETVSVIPKARTYKIPRIALLSQSCWPPLPQAWKACGFDLEIGAGKGSHAVYRARQYPDRMLVAIESTQTKFDAFRRQLQEFAPLPNLLAFRADAIWWVGATLNKPCIKKTFILYPNPYPKPSQAHKRWHNCSFMGLLVERLQSGGTVELATNLHWYFQEAVKELDRTWNLRILAAEPLPRFQTQSPRTHFERKYLARGETCFQIVAQKKKEESQSHDIKSPAPLVDS